MEKLNDFFTEIKNRTTNPFFASFIFSWIIINWKIVIGLFYSVEVLHLDGYRSYSDLIDSNLDNKNTIWTPLLYAILYTIVSPWIRLGVTALYTYTKRISTDTNLKISKEGKISISKYITIRESYFERQSQLEKVLAQDTQYLSKLTEVTTKNNELQSELNNLILNQRNEQANISDIGFLAGEWRYFLNNNSNTSTRITIKQNNISIQDGEIETLKYRINHYFHDQNQARISFCRTSVDTNTTNVFHTLTYNKQNPNELEGLENNKSKIRYVKIR